MTNECCNFLLFHKKLADLATLTMALPGRDACLQLKHEMAQAGTNHLDLKSMNQRLIFRDFAFQYGFTIEQDLWDDISKYGRLYDDFLTCDKKGVPGLIRLVHYIPGGGDPRVTHTDFENLRSPWLYRDIWSQIVDGEHYQEKRLRFDECSAEIFYRRPVDWQSRY